MHFRGNLILLLAAFIWGTTFVAQVVGMDGVGPFTYAASRFALGFLFLLGLWRFYRPVRVAGKKAGTYQSGWKPGVIAGLCMFVGVSMQQVAMLYTTAGKTAFITALYIILVPIGAVLLGKKLHVENWIGAGLAITGLYFLSIRGETAIGLGDGIVLVSSLFWTMQILFIDRFAALVDPIELSAAQIGTCFALSTIGAILFEPIHMGNVLAAWVPICYGGIMSAGVAYTLQIVGQRYAEPGQAAILMSFEAPFCAVSSWLILGEVMTMAQVAGCALMMAGTTVAQIRPLFPLLGLDKKKEVC